MSVSPRYPWLTMARLLGLVALILVLLATLVPGTPDWLLSVAVGLLSVAVLVG